MTRRRYRGPIVGALVLVAVGVATGSSWLVATAGVPLGFVAFGALSGVPDPELSVRRRVEADAPVPGDRVSVTLEVENRSSVPLPDVRVFDEVPDGLEVVEGSPTVATAIPPRGSTTVEYVVAAARGEHGFDRPLVRLRGSAANGTRDRRPAVEGDERLAARVFVEAPPSASETATLVGTTTADAGGSGIEFHTIREYRPGDPINRIDWHRLGRGGELATVNYREQRGRTVVVVADYRPASRIDQAGHRCLYAADRMVQALAGTGTPVGLAALGGEAVPWVEPGAPDALARGRLALRAVDGRASWDGPELLVAAEGSRRTIPEAMADRIPPGAEVVVVTPAIDELAADVHERLDVRGHPVTVVVPGMRARESLGERLVVAQRRAQVERLRSAGVRLVDWSREDPLPVALAESEVRARP